MVFDSDQLNKTPIIAYGAKCFLSTSHANYVGMDVHDFDNLNINKQYINVDCRKISMKYDN